MNWKTVGSPHKIISGNELLAKPFDVAVCMNNYFYKKVKDIRKNINSRLWKCPEIDGLDNFILKISSELIVDPLHHIIVLSVMQEKFPRDWKLAKVIPLHKKDNILDPKNYRPVSILSPLSKVLEGVIYNQLYTYMTRNKILHPSLHGYRQNRSTLTALLEMYEKWSFSASNGHVSGAVFLDLSAAYDLVPPDILQEKLKIYGLDRSFLNWMDDYMSMRFQAVWIDHCFSSYKPCEVGVPQGSILGPLIFLLFINDLSYVVNSDIQQYADDTTVSESNNSIQVISENLNSSCDIISMWMSQNMIKLNPDKTHILLLGTQRRLMNYNDKLNVQMEGLQLEESDNSSETLLGCVIQSNLKWLKQIITLKEKFKKRLIEVSCIRGALPTATLKIIGESWFNSVMVCCLPLFGVCAENDLDDLQIMQNKLARMVTGSQQRANRADMFDKLKWLTVRQQVMYHTLITVFILRTSGEPETLNNIFTNETRNMYIIMPQSNLRLYRKSFTYRGVQGWNKLPNSVKTIEKIGIFKKALRTWIFNEVSKF